MKRAAAVFYVMLATGFARVSGVSTAAAALPSWLERLAENEVFLPPVA